MVIKYNENVIVTIDLCGKKIFFHFKNNDVIFWSGYFKNCNKSFYFVKLYFYM